MVASEDVVVVIVVAPMIAIFQSIHPSNKPILYV